MDANRPITAQEIASIFLGNVRDLTDYEFHRLYSEIEFDFAYLSAVYLGLKKDLGVNDIASLQQMVDEIGRFERECDIELDDLSGKLLEEIFKQLDRLDVDYRRLVFEDLSHVVSLAGDF